jgi:hypothetical protein
LPKPTLVVLKGGGLVPSPWLNIPTTVAAVSPFDPEPVIYRIARHDVEKARAAMRRQPIFDLWSIVLGEPPQVPNVAPAKPGELTCLAEAHACFQGIRRPVGLDDDGSSMLAYILRPRTHYVYEPSMVCVAAKQAVPADLVFAAYVRLDEPFGAKFPGTTGVLTHWQYVEADSDGQVLLPVDYQTRYHKRMW